MKKWFRFLLSIPGWLLIVLIQFYQLAISPWLGPNCRFIPTCSQYAVEVVQKYGLIKGSFKAIKRISKCHQFHPGGYDPP